MSDAPYNAGQEVTVENKVYGPVSTIDFGDITLTENWGRLFIRKGDATIVAGRCSYVGLRDAISHFIEPSGDTRPAPSLTEAMAVPEVAALARAIAAADAYLDKGHHEMARNITRAALAQIKAVG